MISELDCKKLAEAYGMKYKEAEEGFISELIGDDFKIWRRGIFVCLNGKTGCGKNFFYEEKLIPYAIQNRKRVLIMSNRIANNRQIKLNLMKKICPKSYVENYTEKGLDNLIDIHPSVSVYSYQRIAYEIIANPYRRYAFDYVLLDEIHWGISDAEFNCLTELVIDYIIKNFQNAIRIYSTATPDIILPVLIRKENSVKRGYSCYPFGCSPIFYKVKDDFSSISKIYWYDEYSQLLKMIQYSQDRWLIFINSIKIGTEFRKKLEEKGISVSFIHSKSRKDSETNENDSKALLDNKKFTTQCLIATSALDNGITIKDKKLKHIVIFDTDKTQLIQMIGRKRMVDLDDCYNLYIKAPNFTSLGKVLRQKKEINQVLHKIQQGNIPLLDMAINNQLDVDISNFIYGYSGHLNISSLGFLKLNEQIAFLQDLNENADITSYLDMVKSWLHIKENDERSNISYCGDMLYKEIETLFSVNAEIELKGAQLQQFKEELKNISSDVYGSVYQNVNFGVCKTRKFLSKHELPFSLETHGKGIWMIKHINRQ